MQPVDGNSVLRAVDQCDGRTFLHQALFQHPGKIAGFSCLDKLFEKASDPVGNINFCTWYPALGDLNLCIAYLVYVANIYTIFSMVGDGDILTESRYVQLCAGEGVPLRIMFKRVKTDGPIIASMAVMICHVIIFKACFIEVCRRNRLFSYAGIDYPSKWVSDQLRPAYIQ